MADTEREEKEPEIGGPCPLCRWGAAAPDSAPHHRRDSAALPLGLAVRDRNGRMEREGEREEKKDTEAKRERNGEFFSKKL